MSNSKKVKTKKLTADQLAKLDKKFRKVLNPDSSEFADINKSDFKDQFKGKLPFDLNQAWDWIVLNRK